MIPQRLKCSNIGRAQEAATGHNLAQALILDPSADGAAWHLQGGAGLYGAHQLWPA
jgi:hypothetical protein